MAAAGGKRCGSGFRSPDSGSGRTERSAQCPKKATLEAKQEWKLAETNVKELELPSRHQDICIWRSWSNPRADPIPARLAKTERHANKVALEQMGRAYQEAGRFINSISASASRFESSARNLSTELHRRTPWQWLTPCPGQMRPPRLHRYRGSPRCAFTPVHGTAARRWASCSVIWGEVLSLVAPTALGGNADRSHPGCRHCDRNPRRGILSTNGFGGDEGKAAAELTTSVAKRIDWA